LIGDGTISNNYVFKLSHTSEQLEYLEWKLKQLNDLDIKNNGIKCYTSKCGYNTGKEVIYSQLSINPTIKALRRCIYIPNKTITYKLLKWLDAKGLAIWYMDDGSINVNESIHRNGSTQITFHISTCVSLDNIEIIINYFKDIWGINCRKFEERPNLYSISTCSNEDGERFANIIAPYVKQVPHMMYKIRKHGTKNEFLENQEKGLKCETF
jgi:hypothetical protein